MYVIWVA